MIKISILYCNVLGITYICDPASQNHQKVARHVFLVKAHILKEGSLSFKMIYNSKQLDISNPPK